MPNRYYLAPCPYIQRRYDILDRHAVNGYDEPWVEVPGLPYAEALAQCRHLNATWESQLPPCTCPEKER
jgi:hypothetical protein